MFSKKLLKDFGSFLKGPESFFQSVLKIEEFHVSKKMLIFIFAMHAYFVFLPSFLTIFNIVAILIFFISLANIYYFSQEAYNHYCEITGQKQADEESYGQNFYRVAYVYSLAGIPVLVLNLLNNVLCFVLNDNLLYAAFYAVIFSSVIMLFALLLALKLTNVITQGEDKLKSFFNFYLRAFIKTLEQWFGLLTLKEIREDFESLRIN